MIKIFNEDFNNYNGDKVDLIFTDIPYNIGVNAYASNPQWWKDGQVKNGKSDKAHSLFFESDDNFDLDKFLTFSSKTLKKDGRLITFCSVEQLSIIILNYKKYGFKKYSPLIFIKNSSAETLKANMRVVGACEYGVILYKNKLGTFNNNNKMIKNWFEFKRPYKPQHPNQKPIDLCKKIIEIYTNENDTILDICCGVGTILYASKLLNRNCIGYEIDKKYYDIAKEIENNDI